MTLTRRLNPWLTFLSLSVLISLVSSFIARGGRSTLAVAATLDLTLTVTFLYYWLLVRPGLRAKSSMLVIAILGLWRASFLFPAVVPGKFWIGAAFEIAVAVTLWKSRKSARTGTTVERIIASEFAVLYYAVATWRAVPDVPEGTQPFTLHKRALVGDLFYCVSVLSLLEIVPVHLFASHWSHRAAWILTALSIYGAIWLVAMARAFDLRPTLIGPEGITVRYGLLFQLHIPADKFRVVAEATANALIVPRKATPTLFLELTEPLEAEVALGLKKRVIALALSPDDLPAFNAALLKSFPNPE